MYAFSFSENKEDGPKYFQLYTFIKNQIEIGKIEPGEKLLSIRRLSTELGISKITVESAYNQLLVEGYIESKNKSGYYVLEIDQNPLLVQAPMTLNLSVDSLEHPSEFKEQSNHEVTKEEHYYNEGIDKQSFDFKLWKKSVVKVLNQKQDALMVVGHTSGEEELKHSISKFVKSTRGVSCNIDQIIIGAGVQQLLSLLALMFLNQEENVIAFEYPGFSKGQYIFEDYGLDIAPIEIQEDGIDIEALFNSQSKVVYVSPSNQYPTGTVMPINKRYKLLSWAESQSGFIIEDDYDSLLRYSGRPIPALQGLDKNDSVIYLGSFSKLLLPSLRISFMILPHKLLDLYNKVKERYSQTVSKFDQLILADFIDEGHLERHIRKMRKIYTKKNGLLIKSVNRYDDKIQVVGADSGLHVILKFNSDKTQGDIQQLCSEHNIGMIPLENDEKHFIFPFGGIDDEKIDEKVDLIVDLI